MRVAYLTIAGCLQKANAALPEHIVPAANEKLMNAIQLQRILDLPLTEKQQIGLKTLAFSCPLEAGNAVYRARTVLRTQGNHLFDDAILCGWEKKDKGKTSDIKESPSEYQWQIDLDANKHQLWIAGSQLKELQSIQLFDSLGEPVRHQQSEGDARMEIQLPPDLPAGTYLLRLQLDNGEVQTRKILIQP